MERCRIWWPRQQPQPDAGSAQLVLFGWVLTRAGSVDVVVAAAAPQGEILRRFLSLDALQDFVLSSNKKMPIRLQESATFAILGHCFVHLPRKSGLYISKQKHQPFGAQSVQREHFASEGNSSGFANGSSRYGDQDPSDDHRKLKCGCSVLDGFLETCRQNLVKEGNWVRLFCKFGTSFNSNVNQVPELHHLHIAGLKFEINHCHVILYDVPTYGRNHFSLSVWDSPQKLRAPFKKPNWINDLQKKPSLLDLDAVVLALNCSNAASRPIYQKTTARRLYDLAKVTWHCMGIFVASISTIIYIFLQLFQKCLSHISQCYLFRKVFRHSCKNIHLRSCHILYWPIFLQDTALSSSVNVEYAHKAAIQKHAVWSNVVVDLLMGIFFGVTLLLNMDAICFWIFTTAHNMTDGVLRSGCVWLMRVPAGFKLNTELAELLGMISLNAVQIYSTLWFFLGGFLKHIIQGLALSGFFLGLTVPMSFFIDLTQLATLHITTLQRLISLIYSRQIQTVASLWRLFRGRKWNPLRQRLDSYEYTVEQHVVGSLLFTPVLLLLPTTSIFYIFFSILSTTIICLCIMLEIAISIIHTTPCAELILWLTRRQRFPSGLWFLTVSLPSGSTHEDHDLSVENCTSSGLDGRERKHLIHGQSEPFVSLLHCNYATLGQVIEPNYQKVFHGTAFSFCKQLAYGILSGERIPSTLHFQFSPPLPWMHIGIREYWLLCRGSVLSCAPTR